jgi:hypothetical protein
MLKIQKHREIKHENLPRLPEEDLINLVIADTIATVELETIIIQIKDLLRETIILQVIVLRELHHRQIEAIAQEDREVVLQGELVHLEGEELDEEEEDNRQLSLLRKATLKPIEVKLP